jgi:hypothetical protein
MRTLVQQGFFSLPDAPFDSRVKSLLPLCPLQVGNWYYALQMAKRKAPFGASVHR